MSVCTRFLAGPVSWRGAQLSVYGLIAALLLLFGCELDATAQSGAGARTAFSRPMYVRQVPIDCTDLAYDTTSHKLYAALPGTFGPTGNSITTIDPSTGVVEKPIFVGAEPGDMAASGDGKYVYIVLTRARTICRFNVHSQKVDLQFPVNVGVPVHICVSPRNSGRIAVVRQKAAANGFENVGLFDNGVERPRPGPGPAAATTIAFNTDGTRLYGFDGWSSAFVLYRWGLDANGWAGGDQVVDLIGGLRESMVYSNGLLYVTNGRAVDPEQRVVKGVFPDAGGVPAPDPKGGRVLYFRRQDSRLVISAYDSTAFTLVGQTVFPKIAGEPASVQICGDSYAFRSGGKIVLLSPAPGLIEACKSRNWNLAFSTIEEGVNVNCQDDLGATALMWAAYSGQMPLCVKLLSKGADLRLKDTRDATALHYAIESGSMAIMEYMLRKGADPGAGGLSGTPIRVASDRRRPDMVHLLQQYGGR